MTSFRLYSADECGPDGYPPEWHAKVKHAVRAAAGNRCVRCGHSFVVGETPGLWSPCDERCTHGGPVRARALSAGPDEWERDDLDGDDLAAYRTGGFELQARSRVLTVHHLDGNKANLRWWNLVSLCQRCHLTIQGRVKMERVWPWEHSDWFKPYVAGYYASTYLGEELSRPEVMERVDELLWLERMA